MKCPYCGNAESKVTDSRTAEDGIRRRRECLGCGLRFTTYERVLSAALQVIKRDGRREDLNRDKLSRSIRQACAKRPLPTGAIEKVVDEIEAEVQRLGRAEVPTSLIGDMVMERLRALDRVAYIRFASVYRDFADIDNFRDEIDSLLTSREAKAPAPPQLPLIPEEKPMPLEARRRRRPRRPRGQGPRPESQSNPRSEDWPVAPEDRGLG